MLPLPKNEINHKQDRQDDKGSIERFPLTCTELQDDKGEDTHANAIGN